MAGGFLKCIIIRLQKEENMEVNILGQMYRISERKEAEDEKLKKLDGYCDYSSKEIVIAVFEEDPMNVADLSQYKKQVLRHEIIHAFLYESGLDNSTWKTHGWAVNDEMVDWIAIQSPKIFKAFQECNCL